MNSSRVAPARAPRARRAAHAPAMPPLTTTGTTTTATTTGPSATAGGGPAGLPALARAAAIAALTLALLGIGGAAHASDGQHALSVSVGYGSLLVTDEGADTGTDTAHGGVLGVAYSRGFSDALSWRVSGGVGGYYGASALLSGQVSAGLVYRFDVLKYVPYLTAGVGAIVVSDSDVNLDIDPLVELGVGLDVLQSRHRSYGVFARVESLLQNTSFFTAGVRVTWRWGFF
ncbi:MAG: hypothetical protein Tsb0020_37000 [Haliangiales bacterium]